MKKRKTWQSKLTKTELRHLKEDAFDAGTRITLFGLESNFKGQVEMRKKAPDIEPCWTCKGIAQKLGFGV